MLGIFCATDSAGLGTALMSEPKPGLAFFGEGAGCQGLRFIRLRGLGSRGARDVGVTLAESGSRV